MASTERRGNGEAGSRSGRESPERVAIATDEGLQAQRICGEERGLTTALELKPKRVVFPIAGKGGVGKTTVMATLAEWYASTLTPLTCLIWTPTIKQRGASRHCLPKPTNFRRWRAGHTTSSWESLWNPDADVILADLGAAQGHRMIPWFRDFYKVMQDSGLDLRWTALGIVDADIASARSVIEWGGELQNTVDYVIVHNHFQEGVDSSWENPKLEPDVTAFRETFSPVEIRMDARRPDLQRMMRTMNVTLGDVGDRKTNVPELRAPDMTLRARTYRFRAFSQFTEARKVLLP